MICHPNRIYGETLAQHRGTKYQSHPVIFKLLQNNEWEISQKSVELRRFFCERLDNKTFTKRTKFKQNLNKSSGLCLDLFKELQCYVSDEKLRT